MRSVILIAALGAMLGACSMAVNDSPRTTPPGKFKLGLGVGSYLTFGNANAFFPLTGISGRYGISEDMDLGFRIFGVGFGAEVKKSFNQQTAFAFGANISSLGALFYDLYGTFIYGFKPAGSTPYVYFKPHLQGYSAEVSGSDTTFTLGGSGFAIQAGFGFHGNPDKAIQPSIEFGIYYPFVNNAQPIFLLSLGLNFMIGD